MENIITLIKEKSMEFESEIKEILKNSEDFFNVENKIIPKEVREEIKGLMKNNFLEKLAENSEMQQKIKKIMQVYAPLVNQETDRLKNEIYVAETKIVGNLKSDFLELVINPFIGEKNSIENKTNAVKKILSALNPVESHLFVLLLSHVFMKEEKTIAKAFYKILSNDAEITKILGNGELFYQSVKNKLQEQSA